MSKIYTKTGDKGETGLVGGKRVRKSSLRVEAYGTVDELNSCIGLLRSEIPSGVGQGEVLAMIQHRLFSCSSYLATPNEAREEYGIECGVKDEHVKALEENIDLMNETVPPFKFFILPGGSHAAAVTHLCRTVARRAERAIYRFLENEEDAEVDPLVLQFVNRLSDYLFTLARAINLHEGIEDVRWEK